jgi:hypothetical protein
MTESIKRLLSDSDGMATYDYIVNNVDTCVGDLPDLIDNLVRVDRTGQFLASTVRFLAAVDRESFRPFLGPLIDAAIDKDRERRYIGSLLEALWGADYKDKADSLCRTDDNFRRIYKRIYPVGM